MAVHLAHVLTILFTSQLNMFFLRKMNKIIVLGPLDVGARTIKPFENYS